MKEKKSLLDADNPEYLFSCVSADLVVQIANGDIDVLAYAKKEMANRGLDCKGDWVGFDQAKKEWGGKIT